MSLIRPRRFAFLLATLLAMIALAPAASARKAPMAGPYVPTPQGIADRMLAMAGIGPDDYVMDLGSGDGRLVIAAVVKYKARGGAGVDIDADLVKLATENAKAAGVADRVKFIAGDLFATDTAPATVVTLYLLPGIMGEVESKLRRELRPGTRVVTHDYSLPTWKPVDVVTFHEPEKAAISGTTRTVLYLYRVPPK